MKSLSLEWSEGGEQQVHQLGLLEVVVFGTVRYEAPMSFVTSQFQLIHHQKVNLGGPSMNTASGGDCFQFTLWPSHGFGFCSNDSDCCLAVELYGRKTGGLIGMPSWRTPDNYDMSGHHRSNIGRYSGGGSARTHFSNNGFASEITTLDLLLD
ncbi:hypothetical protein Tco_1155294 [Tanacetum coccineum]